MRLNTKHLQHYLPLIGILLFSLIGFSIFSYDKDFQIALLIATAVGYINWGLVHHYIHKDLYLSTFVEYLAISILGVVIVLSIIL